MNKKTFGVTVDVNIQMQDYDLFMLEGMAERMPFYQALTRQAAHFLWYFLTRALFPEKGKTLTAIGTNVPLVLPENPMITTHIGVIDLPSGFEILGTTTGGDSWEVQLSAAEAQRLWGVLDVLLYPMGWQGRVNL